MISLTESSRPTWRQPFLVALLLALLGALVLFWSLDAGQMEPDESLYALATDHVRQSGEYWTLSTHPPSPYFNKPPLYMWLSAATYELLPGFAFKYRFWSAVFGLVATVLTGLVGSRLSRPAVGLIAGLLLLTNRSFLNDHGARFGGMDAGLAACMIGMVLLYVASWNGRSQIRKWAAIGVVAGIASLLKPLGGLPMLAVIGIHASFFRRGALNSDELPQRSDRHRSLFVAFVIALFCTIVVASPWYVINYLRYPHDFFKYLFGQQIVDAVATEGVAGHQRGWSFYWLQVPMSSRHFLLVVLAVLGVAWVGFKDVSRRPVMALILLGTVGWIACFSLAGKKFLHYVYPTFPLLAIAIAGMLAELASVGKAVRRASVCNLVLRVTAAVLVAFALHQALVTLPNKADPSPIWQTYQSTLPATGGDGAAIVFWKLPHRPDRWQVESGVRPQQMIYFSHMSNVVEVQDEVSLKAALAALSQNARAVVFAAAGDEAEVAGILRRFDEQRRVTTLVREKSYVILEVTQAPAIN